jgi:hypothetical protein
LAWPLPLPLAAEAAAPLLLLLLLPGPEADALEPEAPEAAEPLGRVLACTLESERLRAAEKDILPGSLAGGSGRLTPPLLAAAVAPEEPLPAAAEADPEALLPPTGDDAPEVRVEGCAETESWPDWSPPAGLLMFSAERLFAGGRLPALADADSRTIGGGVGLDAAVAATTLNESRKGGGAVADGAAEDGAAGVLPAELAVTGGEAAVPTGVADG